VLIDPFSNSTVAAGMIAGVAKPAFQELPFSRPVSTQERAGRLKHRGAILQLGNREALADRLERSLFDRGHIAIGACADLMLFDPATVGISPSRRVNDLPGGGPRTLRDPLGVHGVFVNGVRVFDGHDYAKLDSGPGQVLDRFLPARSAALTSAAQ